MSTEATKMTNQEQEMVHLTINNIPLAVPKGTKIMQAAQKLGIDIPHLCYHEDQRIKARCRLCSVEVVGKRRLLAACSTEVWEGMEVHLQKKEERKDRLHQNYLKRKASGAQKRYEDKIDRKSVV